MKVLNFPKKKRSIPSLASVLHLALDTTETELNFLGGWTELSLAIENVRKLNLCGRLKEETAGNQRKNKSDSHPSVISHTVTATQEGSELVVSLIMAARRGAGIGLLQGPRSWWALPDPDGRPAPGGSVSYVAAAEPEHEGLIDHGGRTHLHACLLAVAACICMDRGRTCAHARPALLCTASSSRTARARIYKGVVVLSNCNFFCVKNNGLYFLIRAPQWLDPLLALS